MPKVSEAEFRRRAVLRVAKAHPDWTYQRIADDIARILRPPISRQRVEQIVKAARPEGWRKDQLQRYTCSVCGAKFAGVKGYSGSTARRCPEHRRRRTA